MRKPHIDQLELNLTTTRDFTKLSEAAAQREATKFVEEEYGMDFYDDDDFVAFSYDDEN